jgi:acetyl esterase/lipase
MRFLLATLLIASSALAAEPKVQRDIPYAGTADPGQTLDVYAPAEGKGHPVVFWIHGGGWQVGDKRDADVKPQALTDRGYVFVSTNYRLFPKATIGEMAGDVAKAIRWTRDHAAEFGGDPAKFFVTGHSAGAQLAALVCIDGRYLEAEGMKLSAIKGCIPVDGDTFDVPVQVATVEDKRAKSYRTKFGDGASQKDLSPISHVAKGKGIPPVLILHVAGHPETGAQSRSLVEALRLAEVEAAAYPAEGKAHVSINADLGTPGDLATKAMLDFIERHLKD